MHGTDLAEEPRTKLRADAVGLYESAPKSLHRGSVVGRVLVILVKGDSVWDLHGHGPDMCFQIQCPQSRHDFGVEVGDGARDERECFGPAITGSDDERVVDEIEVELESP